MRADVGANVALLDRLAAAGAGGDLPVAVKAKQLAAAKHRLRLSGRAGNKILHQYFVGEFAVHTQTRRAQVMQGKFEIAGAPHEPDATARGAHRCLEDARKPQRFAKLGLRLHDARRRLRQAQTIEQPAEAGLAVHHAVVFE